jgi:NADH-quinone oxidoreductase subunit L
MEVQGFAYVPLIIGFPLLGLLVNILFGDELSEGGIGFVACTAAAASFVVALLTFLAVQIHPEGFEVSLFTWIRAGDFEVPAALLVDPLSSVMTLVVTGVGTLIHIYAVGYMRGDPRIKRFFVYMNLFLASMLVLVLGNNFVVLFVGWELVGLCSYLLIGFWYEKLANARAAMKAFVVNRIGDAGFILGIFLIWTAFGSVLYADVFPQAEAVNAAMPGVITAITLLLLIGATGKSAQIPLFVWLPDAMAGPTPVSALIHAATMVTAGVYMVARTHALYSLAPTSQLIVGLIGAATALLAATIGVGQFDIKRVLAYSTISQLGFMIAAVGIGAYVAGMFHLVTHAFFKALLFLSAGSVIHGVEHGEHSPSPHSPPLIGEGKGERLDPQDMRNLGGLAGRMRTTFIVYLIGALALAGIFPLSGFWSKDEILAEALQRQPLVFALLLSAAFFTAFYVGRQLMLVFFGRPRTAAAAHAQESGPIMLIPLIVLAVLAFFGGALNLPGVGALGSFLEHTLGHEEAAEFNPLLASMALGLAVLGLALAYGVYRTRPITPRDRDPLTDWINGAFTWLNRKWYVDEIYGALFVRPYIWLSGWLANAFDERFIHDFIHDVLLTGTFVRVTRTLAQGVDLGIIDGIANGIARLTQAIGARLRWVQSGYLRNYALSLLLGVVLIVGYLLLRTRIGTP